MPKLWNETIDMHRRAVREATLDATAALVIEHGLLSVTMSRIAEKTGIGRATLYKYFPDVEAILLAWHERQLAEHLASLAEARDRASGPLHQLEAVLEAYALIEYQHHAGPSNRANLADAGLEALLHRGKHHSRAHQQLSGMVRDLLRTAAAAGDVRNDIGPEELAAYCVHALAAAKGLPSRAAVRRLVELTMDGLRPR